MGSNSFGNLFRITTWGESHGKALGVVIDGCPAGVLLSEKDIQVEMSRRAPGKSPFTSPRKEADLAEIYSGVFEGKTTGAPISIIIFNKDADSSKYEPIKHLLRPGHANYTYLAKYGIFDYRGGGRASARETVGRVAAGAVAKKFLKGFGIVPEAKILEIGGFTEPKKMEKALEKAMLEKDSLGGIVEGWVENMPIGLGEPIFEKIEAKLAKAMLSLPAVKGFEIGAGFSAAKMRGSACNDLFYKKKGKIALKTNHSGGTLGGITTGMPLSFRVAFKPPSSIPQPQETLTIDGKKATFNLPEGSRHDPCVVIRALSVVEAMTALVLADAVLQHQSGKYDF